MKKEFSGEIGLNYIESRIVSISNLHGLSDREKMKILTEGFRVISVSGVESISIDQLEVSTRYLSEWNSSNFHARTALSEEAISLLDGIESSYLFLNKDLSNTPIRNKFYNDFSAWISTKGYKQPITSGMCYWMKTLINSNYE